MDFSLCCWNILAASYSHSNSPLYSYCPKEFLSFSHRFPRVLEEILSFDLIALQEVDRFHEIFEPALKQADYQYVFAKRGCSPSSPSSSLISSFSQFSLQAAKQDGVLIAWKKGKFRPLAMPFVVDYNQLAYSTGQTRYLRHNIGVFVYLLPSVPGARPLLLANTHLYWNPLYETLKLRQTILLLQTIEKSLKYFPSVRSARHFHLDFLSLPDGLDYPGLSVNFSSSSLENFDFCSLSDPLKEIPIFLCGDFNSTPQSSLYSFLLKGFSPGNSNTPDSQAGPETTRKFLTDSDLYKVAKLLRAIGNDVEHYSDQERQADGIAGMFKRAKEENRILLTRSRALIQRRNCPETAFLLSTHCNPDEAFLAIIFHYGLQFDRAKFYSRCTLCNAGVSLQSLEILQANPPDDFPIGLRSGRDETGRQLKFYRCEKSSCAQLYWFGGASESAARHFQNLFDKLEQDKEKKGTEEEEKEERQAELNEERAEQEEREQKKQENGEEFPADRKDSAMTGDRTDGVATMNLDVPLTHPFSFYSCYGFSPLRSSEPEFTNFALSFQDCLDYIFYTRGENASFSLNLKSLVPLLERSSIEPFQACPNAEWPSDHLLLGGNFSISWQEEKENLSNNEGEKEILL